jgi:hypothetical protein
MKNELKTNVDSISREEEELHIWRILTDYKHRPKLVKNCLKYLYKNIFKSNEFKPKTDFDTCKCVEVLLNCLVNSNDMDINRIVVIICVKLIKEISVDEKSTLSSNPIYNKTLEI